ncbi:hypothetical protein H310_02442 [Aphanomyces invadans]|uniref:Uncharacterized protein n=1 Tax=Aphanomyces invadans TaxID=157072 RepID=A0A024UQF5_9STRA|nr:hypothetical protein H310_02442 [Aphanomyces invadans]ETW08077.1 hypothetical protein H310_02442 [Aphanomyces invadans]|eukprot:XP_008864170.1 hypothetical protein H310_02442 [Aphanomyces invadans]
MKKNSRFKARSNYVKPHLTPANVEERLKFAMSFVRSLPSGRHGFDDMHEDVHVDEKWFYLTKVKRRYYVYDDEEVAARAVKSKRFITKPSRDMTHTARRNGTARLVFGPSFKWLQRSVEARTGRGAP